MLEYSCYSKVRNGNLPVSFEIPVAEVKVAMDVLYFDMAETFWDKLLCMGKGPITELMKTTMQPKPNGQSWKRLASLCCHFLTFVI